MLKSALIICLTGAVALAQETPRPAVTPTLSAQVMLDAAGFSTGVIDGKAGANFGRAVAAFQRSRSLASRAEASRYRPIAIL